MLLQNIDIFVSCLQTVNGTGEEYELICGCVCVFFSFLLLIIHKFKDCRFKVKPMAFFFNLHFKVLKKKRKKNVLVQLNSKFKHHNSFIIIIALICELGSFHCVFFLFFFVLYWEKRAAKYM